MTSLLRKAGNSLLLILGVTLLSFILMVWFGPDRTYGLRLPRIFQELIPAAIIAGFIDLRHNGKSKGITVSLVMPFDPT